MKKIIIVALAFLFSLNVLAEQASEESIRDLMNKTGAGDLGMQMMNQMMPDLKAMTPNAPAEFWDSLMEEIKVDEIVELTIPVYQNNLTQEDIDGLNTFYDSELGQKVIKVMPMILQESMMIGQMWGQDLVRRVIEKYEAEYEPAAEL